MFMEFNKMYEKIYDFNQKIADFFEVIKML